MRHELLLFSFIKYEGTYVEFEPSLVPYELTAVICDNATSINAHIAISPYSLFLCLSVRGVFFIFLNKIFFRSWADQHLNLSIIILE